MKRSQRKWWMCLACLPGLLWLPGCEFSVGPQTQTKIVFVRYQGIAARVIESKKVQVAIEKDGSTYTDTVDIGGFYVISPDQKPEPKPAEKGN
jgi:hypothetical protein